MLNCFNLTVGCMYSMCIDSVAQVLHGILHEGTLILLDSESILSQSAQYFPKDFHMLLV